MSVRLHEGEARPGQDQQRSSVESREAFVTHNAAFFLRGVLESELVAAASYDRHVREGIIGLRYDEGERRRLDVYVDEGLKGFSTDEWGSVASRTLFLYDRVDADWQAGRLVLPPTQGYEQVQPRIEKLQRDWKWGTLADDNQNPELVQKAVKHFMQLRRQARFRRM